MSIKGLLKKYLKNISLSWLILCTGAIVLFSCIVMIYWSTLHSPFIFDDIPNITKNPYLKIEEISVESFRHVFWGKHPNPLRKLPLMSFAVNFLTCGENPWCYHATNIAIHIICGFLIWWLSFQLLRVDWLPEEDSATRLVLSWFTAMIWALHPIQINAVTYIVQRMTSMAAMFALLSIIFWLKARESYYTGKGRGVVFLRAAISVVSFFLGLFCKENIVVLPFLIVATEYFFIRKGGTRLPVLPILSFLFTVGILIYILVPPERIAFITAGYERRDFNMLERLLTQSRVLFHYITLFFFPAGERFSLLYEFPVSRGIFLPFSTFLSLLFWFFLGVGLWCYRHRFPIASWTLAWFLIGHMVESTIIPLEIIFEHRNYLPSFSLAFWVVIQGRLILKRFLHNPKMQFALGIVVLLVLMSGVLARNFDYHDSVYFYRMELKKFPQSRRLRISLAMELNRRGEYEEGGALLKRTVELFPEDITILVHWYMYLIQVHEDKERAEKVYNRIVTAIQNNLYDGRHGSTSMNNLAKFFMEQGRFRDALFLFDTILEEHANLPQLWYKKGICLAQLGEWSDAVYVFERALKMDENNYPLMYWLGKSLIQSGRVPEGCGWVKRSLDDPRAQRGEFISRQLYMRECRENPPVSE